MIYLHAMRKVATAHGVPFLEVDDQLSVIPDELMSISDKISNYIQVGGALVLSDAEERVLSRRYIHSSAHWNAAVGRYSDLDVIFINRPAEGRKRRVH